MNFLNKKLTWLILTLIERTVLNLEEFNLRFLHALNSIPRGFRDLASGSNGRHPLLRTVLLHNVQDDIKRLGPQETIKKWAYFIDCPELARGNINIEARVISTKGRKRLNIPFTLICDTLKKTGNIYQSAAELGCSRAYIYREAGVDKIRELLSKGKYPWTYSKRLK